MMLGEASSSFCILDNVKIHKYIKFEPNAPYCSRGVSISTKNTMTAAKKWNITASLCTVWTMGILDKNDSLHNNGRLIILILQKSHSDMRFRFRDFLQYVTVLPNFSERIDVLSER